MEYEFTLPDSGKKLRWRPLTAQESMDLDAAYRLDANKHMRRPVAAIRRIVFYDGSPVAPTQAQWGTWSEDDLSALCDEIDEKDAIRRSAYRKAAAGSDAFGVVMKAIEDAQQASMMLSSALKFLMESHVSYERSKGPLEPPAT